MCVCKLILVLLSQLDVSAASMQLLPSCRYTAQIPCREVSVSSFKSEVQIVCVSGAARMSL